ncbi:MAG: cyclic pyranopterin monophosphate synthase MoaC [Planctomycetota bacterium]|nr:MAG: cyclic pyranopterin monophosphate synthase MoaC [Planctomycetota bacterium]
MVDVGNKAVTRRRAQAEARIVLGEELLARVFAGGLPKGDVLAVARVAGIQGGKRCSDLIPLCHPLPLSQLLVDFEEGARGELRVFAEAQCEGKTGVEMEALTACSVAALTVYDMCKAASKSIRIEGLRLLAKDGGKSGPWRADTEPQTSEPRDEGAAR